MANSNAVLGKIEHSAKVELDSNERIMYKINKEIFSLALRFRRASRYSLDTDKLCAALDSFRRIVKAMQQTLIKYTI